MKSLKERIAHREYVRKVNSGEIKDTKISLGIETDTPVENNDSEDNVIPDDIAKLTTHAAANDALGGRQPPEGWGEMKVADKQKWLANNRPSGW